MKKAIPSLSVIISSYNTKSLLKQTLTSLKKAVKEISYEIIVIDDASADGSREMVNKYFPEIKLVINKHNLGYSKSYNRGSKAAKGKYILHLNSDVRFLPNSSLKHPISYMNQNPNVGIVGCKILKKSGELDLPCKRSFPTPLNIFFQSFGLHKLFPKSKLFGRYYLTYLDINKIADVDCIMGAFMLIRRTVFQKIGYLDENFFFYGEDIDFCYRAKQAGWRIIYHPKVAIRHLHGGTTRRFKAKYIWHFHYSMYQYYRKHHADKSMFLLNLIVYAGIAVRLAFTLFTNSIHLVISFLTPKVLNK